MPFNNAGPGSSQQSFITPTDNSTKSLSDEISMGLSWKDTPGTSYDQPIESFKWDNKSIKLLLNIRLCMEKDFCTPSCKKKKLWDKVANELNEVLGSHRVTGDACDSKYRNLLGTYRVNKRKQNTTGESAIKWEFFDTMDEVLGHKASSAPPKNLLGSSMESTSANTSVDIQQNSDEDETDFETSDSYVHPKESKKKKEKMSINKYLSLKFEKDKEKQKQQREWDELRWQERKELKLKEIDAINNLAAAILSTNKNKDC